MVESFHPQSPKHFFKSLSKREREIIVLLNIGTFLEYFDFKIYIHIAIILNALFFPPGDSYSNAMLAAFSFSMAYLLRPIGSLIFGILGDLWGRKTNILITTMAMSIASFFMGVMPTYAQVGIKASIGVLVCRIVQGICSAVEVTGASVYIIETFKAPRSFFLAALIWLFAGIGGLFALFCCSCLLHLHPEDGWRYVFFLGSGIAVIGMIARSTLKETPEFLAYRHKRQGYREPFLKSIVPYKRNAIAYFLACLLSPFSFFVSVIYLSSTLTQNYGYSSADIITHNLFIVLFDMVGYCAILYLTLYINPLKILKVMSLIYILIALAFPLAVSYAASPLSLFIIQALVHATFTDAATGVFARGFPVLGRYTLLGFSYSLARAIAAVCTSYGCVYIGEQYGIWGIGLLLMVMAIIRALGIFLFVPCEEDQYQTKESSSHLVTHAN